MGASTHAQGIDGGNPFLIGYISEHRVPQRRWMSTEAMDDRERVTASKAFDKNNRASHYDLVDLVRMLQPYPQYVISRRNMAE
eukprot:scaffold315_cov145-Amphora_coffeaeformis.AAC.1